MLADSTRPFRLSSPAEHALTLHPTGLGRVTIAQRQKGRWQETSVPLADLADALGHFRGEYDVYLTQNRFFGPRRIACLAQLDALFADLDYYKTSLADAHPRHVLELALEVLSRAKLPQPSFAVSTGRGLALTWLHTPMPRCRVGELASRFCTRPCAASVLTAWPRMLPVCCASLAPGTAPPGRMSRR